MKLIIGEKPTLAKNIAAAISDDFEMHEGYMSNDNYIVTWAFGHIFTLADVEDYTGEPKKWTTENLPFCPKTFKFKPKEKTQKHFELIKKLLHKKEVTEVIHAGDADREGEIIIRIILQEAKNKKPVYRLWLPDQTKETIREGLDLISPDSDYDKLAEEGMLRLYSDWLYGINLTRYVTCRGTQLWRVGRVTTPIVQEIYNRDIAIRNYVPTIQYGIRSQSDGIDISSKRLHEKKDYAAEDARRYNKEILTVTKIDSKDTVIQAGKLFSLSTLQSYVGMKYHYSPASTLSTLQLLYEKGLVTYPRTNSEYLASAEKARTRYIIEKLAKTHPIEFKDSKRIFDDTKIESHSALTPTTDAIFKYKDGPPLYGPEEIIYKAILNRFLAVFCTEPLTVTRTTASLTNGIESFEIKGAIQKTKGWSVFEEYKSEDVMLPEMTVGMKILPKFKAVEKKSSPPKKYTIETFNAFLKNPFRKELSEADDDDYTATMRGASLGTEATRAGLIEAAIKSGYITLKKSTYAITPHGERYIEFLNELNISMGKEETVALGVLIKNNEIKKGIGKIMETISKKINEATPASDNKVICKCPNCGEDVIETAKSFRCKAGDAIFSKGDNYFAAAKMPVTEALAKLVFSGKPFECKGLISKKTGKKYDATITVTWENNFPKYALSFPEKAQPEATGKVVGSCPICGNDVTNKGNYYGCECGFKLYRNNNFFASIGVEEITPEIAGEIIETGQLKRADFVSKKTGKVFAATVAVDFSGDRLEYAFINEEEG